MFTKQRNEKSTIVEEDPATVCLENKKIEFTLLTRRQSLNVAEEIFKSRLLILKANVKNGDKFGNLERLANTD